MESGGAVFAAPPGGMCNGYATKRQVLAIGVTAYIDRVIMNKAGYGGCRYYRQGRMECARLCAPTQVFALGDAVFLKLVEKGSPADTQFPRGLDTVFLIPFQGLGDYLAFEILDDFF